MKEHLLTGLLLAILPLTFSGCMYFKDRPPKKEETYSSEATESSCKLDTAVLSKIFDTDIESGLRCVEENLHKFKNVERVRPDAISRDELNRFVTKFFDADASTTTKALNLLYQLNHTYMGQPDDQLLMSDIERMINVLVVFNRQAVKVTKSIQDRKSTRLNSSHSDRSRMPSSA